MAMDQSNPLVVLTFVIDLKKCGTLLSAMILVSQRTFCSSVVKPPMITGDPRTLDSTSAVIQACIARVSRI